jgi:hypothetical protein
MVAAGSLLWFNQSGTWATFRFFGSANRWQTTPSGHRVEWDLRAGVGGVTLPSGKPFTVRYDLEMAGAPPIFRPDYLASLRCVSRVVE